jgi:hypothetical protein
MNFHMEYPQCEGVSDAKVAGSKPARSTSFLIIVLKSVY